MSNLVILKGKKDRLEIKLNTEADFLAIANELKEKIIAAKNFIGSSKQAIEFVDRNLTEEEENTLVKIITANSNIIISYVFNNRLDSNEAPKSYVSSEKPTKFHTKSLRSGSIVEFSGNVVIIGDVNPGSVIKAGGNVLVLGYLNGTVYAGLDGDENAFIGALYLNPVQMTIGKITAIGLQKEILDTNRVNKNTNFKFAKINNDKIIIEERI